MNDLPTDSESVDRRQLDRFDMTGKNLGKWRVGSVRRWLVSVKAFFSRVADYRPPDDDETLGERATTVPRKIIDLADSKLTESAVQRDLRIAQTQQAFNAAELARRDIELRQEQITGAKLDNELKKLEYLKRAAELFGDRPPPQIIVDKGRIYLGSDAVAEIEAASANEVDHAAESE